MFACRRLQTSKNSSRLINRARGISPGEIDQQKHTGAMGVKIVRALNRGLDVLQAIQESKAAGLHDLHRSTSLPKPTLLRILKTLMGRDLVWQRIADGAYIASYTFSQRAGVIDEETHLAEVAAPIMAALCKRVRWPSILAVPRLDHMVVIETNRPMSYFNYILAAPIGFRINMLRSASGRAY
jgi:IclR family mhp operon transcriptional activator